MSELRPSRINIDQLIQSRAVFAINPDITLDYEPYQSCRMCMQSYDLKNIPILLQCGHFLCQQCKLHLLGKGMTKCPMTKCQGSVNQVKKEQFTEAFGPGAVKYNVVKIFAVHQGTTRQGFVDVNADLTFEQFYNTLKFRYLFDPQQYIVLWNKVQLEKWSNFKDMQIKNHPMTQKTNNFVIVQRYLGGTAFLI